MFRNVIYLVLPILSRCPLSRVVLVWACCGEQKLAFEEFAALHPDNPAAASSAFVAFTGLFGQVCTESSHGLPVVPVAYQVILEPGI